MTTAPGLRPGDLRQSLSDVARDYLREKITTGAYVPGDRLKERELSEELGISRIPIREALAGLAAEGFVTLQPRRGAVVTELMPADLEKIFEVREVLEVQETVLATRHATDREVANLVEVSERTAAYLRDERWERVAEGNAEFHELLVEMSHNDILAGMLVPLRGRLRWLFQQNNDGAVMCSEHSSISSAIAARDEAAARRLAGEHVASSRTLAMSLLFGMEQDRGRA